MAERRRMVIEVVADTTAFTQQVRAAVQGVGGAVTVPAASPVGATVPAVGAIPGVPATLVGGSTATQTAVAAALQQAQAAAAQYAMPMGASSPNWSVLMQNAVTGAMYPDGASSPNWSYLLAQQGGGGGAARQPAARVPRSAWLSGASRGRALLGAYGALEVSHAYQSVQQGSLRASLADSDVEAFSANVGGVTGGLGGLLGSTVGTIWDIGGSAMGLGEFTPGGQRAVAMTEAKRRQQLETVQTSIFSRQQGVRTRAAEASGSTFEEQRARVETSFENATRTASTTERAAVDRLNSGQSFKFFGFIPTNWWDADVKDPGERTALSTSAKNAAADRAAASVQRDADLAEIRRKEDIAFRHTGHAERLALQLGTREIGLETAMLGDVSSGLGERDVRRRSFERESEQEISDAIYRGGNPAATRAAVRARRAAMEFQFRRDDENAVFSLQGGAAVNRLAAAGEGFQATLLAAQNTTREQVRLATQDGVSPERIEAIQAMGRSQINALVADRNRSFVQSSIGITASSNALTSQLANNPLQSQLDEIRGNRDAAIAGVTEAGPFGALRRWQIGQNAGLQEQVATRNFNRVRSDANLHLSGAIERAELGISGGPSRFIRQQISGIVEQTEDDVRGFMRSGMGAEAQRRRELGGLQLRQSEAEFYRSIQYGEASPRGVFGTGTLGDVGGAFSAAQAAVSRSGQGESDKPASSKDIKDLGELLRRLFADGIGAVVS